MDQIGGLRLRGVRWGLALTALGSAAAAWWGMAAAAGALLGGCGGVAGFALLARRIERLRGAAKEPFALQLEMARGAAVRWSIYVACLGAAYLIDPAARRALAAAALALVTVSLAMMSMAALPREDGGRRP